MPVRVVEATGPRTTLHVAVDPSSTAPSGPVTLDVRVPISSPVTATGTYRLSAEGVASLEVRTGSGSTAARSVRGVVDVESGSGSVEIEGASGDVRARSSNGNITVHDARGRVDVTTGNGNVRIGNVDGDVRVDSINARIDIRCVRGRVDVSDTNGVVELSAVDGDVDAVSSTGKANYRGKIFANRRYRLQTLSGAVRFVVEGVRPGFRGEITTYSGKIEARGATVGGDAGKAAKHRRLAVRFGDGLARIELDSFDGRLGLVALEDETPDPCGSAPSQ